MSYTIPEYVDTPEQAILAVASAVKGEQVTGGDGNVGTALDILADALAGENVTVPMTNQGAILALAQYVSGGGGGGDSDLTTATVTIVNNVSGLEIVFFCPCCDDVYEPPAASSSFFTENASDEFKAILYKGSCSAYSDMQGVAIAATGNVEPYGLGGYTITGDCTFTFSEAVYPSPKGGGVTPPAARAA